MKNVLTLSLLLGALCLTSCVKENEVDEKENGFQHGAFITNEGGAGNSNGSVSYFDTDSAYIINHLFESINGRPLGDIVQSVSIAGDKAFIVVNNSQKVEIVDLKTFLSIGSIEGLEYPKSFLAVNDEKGYLTDGNFAGRVYVIDLNLLKITDTIPCGFGPDKLILYKENVLVANSGGWGNDSTITVINTATDKVSATWMVGMNPADLVIDKDQQLWVLCKGKVIMNADFTINLETPSTLVSVDPGSGQIKQSRIIGMVGDFYWPQRIGINKNKDRIYYLEAGGIYAISSTGAIGSSMPLVSGNYYGFGVDPLTDLIYALYAPSFAKSGWMYRYSSEGIQVDSLEVGIGPSQIVFN